MRVVCTLCETIVILVPTTALISVDLPTLGAPISATKPQRRPAASPAACSTTDTLSLHAFARQHSGGGGLFGGTLGAAKPLGGCALRQLDRDTKFRVMVGALALDLLVVGGRQPARLR